jgi:hypothetical protein
METSFSERLKHGDHLGSVLDFNQTQIETPTPIGIGTRPRALARRQIIAPPAIAARVSAAAG